MSTGDLESVLGPDKEPPVGETEEPSGKPKEVPDYLRDLPPKGKKKFCMWALMHGKSEDNLEEEGFNPGTVRIAAWELEKLGHRKRVKEEKPPPGTGLQTVMEKGVQVFAKGSPPEALINAISIPMEDGQVEGFEKGLKFGANIIVLGVRIAQELSNLGVQQARPLVEMARDMRSGEAAAAKSAAGEAATLAAMQIQQNLEPYLSAMSKPVDVGGDPMKNMMTRVMEPIMQRMIGSVLPGAGPEAPSGWTKKKE